MLKKSFLSRYGLSLNNGKNCILTISFEYKRETDDIEREFKRYYAEVSAEESPPFSGVVG